MIRITTLLAATSVSAALVLGCREAGYLTAPADLATPPSSRAEHGTLVNGFYMGGDPSNPLAVGAGFEAGITPEDVCAGNHGTPQLVGPGVSTSPGGFHVHTSGSDVKVDVFAFGGGPVSDACQLVGAALVATGTGRASFHLNVSGPGATVAHVTVQGTVELVEGGQARLFATARVTILPDGTLLFDVERVRLTPL